MFIEWIKSLFNDIKDKIKRSPKEEQQTHKDAQKYYDISKENITAIIAKGVSILAFCDSAIHITSGKKDGTKRTEYLNKLAKKEFSKAVRKISAALGTGMIASIPYCCDNGLGKRIYVNTITKDRFWITGNQGDDITEIIALADSVVVNEKRYLRWTQYSINNGIYTIKNIATNTSNKKVPLESIPAWNGIQEEITIAGVDRLPVAFYSCPANGRQPDSVEGFPITYGCDSTLKKIEKTLNDIEREFEKKKARLLVPRMYLKPSYDKDGKVINTFDNDLFTVMSDGEENKLTIFDPAIRESAYYTKLKHHFSFIEKEIGLSEGILTELVTKGATATEIKNASHSTFSFTDLMHQEYENYFETLIYSINVLCNYYNLTPLSDYFISYDWDYSMLEDSDKTWNQMKDLQSIGGISKAELRAWQTGEDIEAAQQKVDEIAKKEPTLQSLMGMSE